MADDEPVERATTALVYRTVDDMGKRMDAHFDGVKLRLDKIEPVEGRVDGHDRILTNHEARLLVIEGGRSVWSMWLKVSLPPLAVACIAVVLTIIFH